MERALALHVLVAVARGLDGRAAARWLDGLDVRGSLQPEEAEYVEDVADGVRLGDAHQATAVEALAVLLWAAGLAGEPPLDEPAEGAATVLGPPLADPALALAGAERAPEPALEEALQLYRSMVAALAADPELYVGAAPGPVDPYVPRRRLESLLWLARIV